ncbi:MAG: hypothetical protein HGA71_11785 [Azonexaceae bacterium]|nr:hypothetical protein [Azonexaceae bacterium]
MATTIYLTGQNNFGNRGCEALVRSTVATLRTQIKDAHFLVPSFDIPRDSAQWPEAAENGVTFVPAPRVPASYRWWGRLCRLVPFLKSRKWPSLRGLPNLEEYLQKADAVVSIGGDNYSLDYGVVSLFFFVGIAERAMELGKKTALWGASVGPFSQDGFVEKGMVNHLNRMNLVSVRESHSVNYLKSIGAVKSLQSVVDSAFALNRQSVDPAVFLGSNVGGKLIGLNVSEVMQISLKKYGSDLSVISETANFIDYILKETSYCVLLVPHVAPLNGDKFNNDEVFLDEVKKLVSQKNSRLLVTPSGLNCCQLKDVISKCHYFIGGRTHATIAALSTGVPTISIAYSIKARGINLDLFGHEDFVLPTPKYSCDSLINYLGVLEKRDSEIRSQLEKQIPVWKDQAAKSAFLFAGCISANV